MSIKFLTSVVNYIELVLWVTFFVFWSENHIVRLNVKPLFKASNILLNPTVVTISSLVYCSRTIVLIGWYISANQVKLQPLEISKSAIRTKIASFATKHCFLINCWHYIRSLVLFSAQKVFSGVTSCHLKVHLTNGQHDVKISPFWTFLWYFWSSFVSNRFQLLQKIYAENTYIPINFQKRQKRLTGAGGLSAT